MGQNSGLLSSLTDWNSTLAGYADSISTGVVMPVALTLLALFMILELYNATQRIAMNGSNNAFTIQQIALVMLKIVVCRWAVVHTTEILNALFEVASTVTTLAYPVMSAVARSIRPLTLKMPSPRCRAALAICRWRWS